MGNDFFVFLSFHGPQHLYCIFVCTAVPASLEKRSKLFVVLGCFVPDVGVKVELLEFTINRSRGNCFST